jgi:hypothetical protein
MTEYEGGYPFILAIATPFDKLRANGFNSLVACLSPFVVSLSNHHPSSKVR